MTKVLIKGSWEGVKEDLWNIENETLLKFADDDGTVYVICDFKKGEPQYNFISKKLWFDLEKIEEIIMNPKLSDEEKKQIIDKLH